MEIREVDKAMFRPAVPDPNVFYLQPCWLNAFRVGHD
jgi:hypothetical protein